MGKEYTHDIWSQSLHLESEGKCEKYVETQNKRQKDMQNSDSSTVTL